MGTLTKEKIVEKIKGLLETDFDFDFLLELKKDQLETLVACIRARIAQMGE